MPVAVPDSLIDQALSMKRKGFKLSEIAEKLQKPLTTVKNWVYSVNPDKHLTTNALADRVERIVLKKIQPPKILESSNQVRSLLAKEAMLQARLLSRNRPSYASLATTTGKDGSQGRTALAKQLAEFSSTVFGWDSEKPTGTLDMSAPREIEATIVSDSLQTPAQLVDTPKPDDVK